LDKTTTLIEVKNVVGASYKRGLVPKNRSTVGVYEVDETNQQYALFPHGAQKSGLGVVSDRAIKHIHELTNLVGTKTAEDLLIKAAVLFIVNRSDCDVFRPCHEADILFSQVLYRAYTNGVSVIVQEIIWTKQAGTTHNIATLGKRLPIFFDEVVKEEIDEVLLKKVLDYNETFKR
jgi:DNA-binding sugar fermentation-stimulating protein